MTEPFRLTDLYEASPGLRRVTHAYTTSGTWKGVLCRVLTVAQEVMRSVPRDCLRSVRATRGVPIRIESGVRPEPDARRIALYVHFSATGQISEMVRRHLYWLGQSGFTIVFVSMAERIPEAEWQAVRQLCALVVQRRNFGLDFGAWRDLLPEVRRRWQAPEELLLVNDSVLGPIHPIAPLIDAMRAGGDGLFGLTESLQGGPHLQSYMLLVRGQSAVHDVMHFIQTLYVSHSKWLLVQLSEIRLARWMRRRGHRVAALFGYQRLVEAVVADAAERQHLVMTPATQRCLELGNSDDLAAMLVQWPLNPTSHLWHVLATRFGSPFIKTQLVLRNSGRLPGGAGWPDVVSPDAPCPLPILMDHLATVAKV